MEIRLKTAEEFHDAHMTIEIRATPEEAVQVSERLTGSRSDEVRERSIGELRRRVTGLEKALAESRTLLALKAAAYDHDRRTERDRAERTLANNLARRLAEVEAQRDRLIQEANSREALHAQVAADDRRSITARDHLLAVSTTRVKRALEVLRAPKVAKAQDEIVTTKGAVLADAIGNAIAALSE